MVKSFAENARQLARNPLGIIALFIVLIYGLASMVITVNSTLTAPERFPIIIFLVVFPVIVLGVFGWLVSQHNEKLYAPIDFASDEGFHAAMKGGRGRSKPVANLDRDISETVSNVLGAEEFISSLKGKVDFHEALTSVAEKITDEIRDKSFISIDTSEFSGPPNDQHKFPVAAFPTLNALTDEVYFLIDSEVGPYEYGYSWVLKFADSGAVVENLRMISGAGPGRPMLDRRSLSEVEIHPGTKLIVSRV